MDVDLARIVFVRWAEEWNSAEDRGGGGGKQHRNRSRGQVHDQRFEKKLPADVRLLCAERAAQTYFTDALLDRDEHDVHYPDPADPQGQCANEKEQRFNAQGKDLKNGLERLGAEKGK